MRVQITRATRATVDGVVASVDVGEEHDLDQDEALVLIRCGKAAPLDFAHPFADPGVVAFDPTAEHRDPRPRGRR